MSTWFIDLPTLRRWPWEVAIDDDEAAVDAERWIVTQKDVLSMLIFPHFDGQVGQRARPPQRLRSFRPQGRSTRRGGAAVTPLRGEDTRYFSQRKRPFLAFPSTPMRSDAEHPPGSGGDGESLAFAVQEIELTVCDGDGGVLETIVLMGCDLMVMEDRTKIMLKSEAHCDKDKMSAEKRGQWFRDPNNHPSAAPASGKKCPSMLVRNFAVEVPLLARSVILSVRHDSEVYGVRARNAAVAPGEGDHYSSRSTERRHFHLTSDESGSSTILSLYEDFDAEDDFDRVPDDQSLERYRLEIVLDRIPDNEVLRAQRKHTARDAHLDAHARHLESKRTMLSAADAMLLTFFNADSGASSSKQTTNDCCCRLPQCVRVMVRLTFVLCLFVLALPLSSTGGAALQWLDLVIRVPLLVFFLKGDLMCGGGTWQLILWFSVVLVDLVRLPAEWIAPGAVPCGEAIKTTTAVAAVACSVWGCISLLHRTIMLLLAVIVFSGNELRAPRSRRHAAKRERAAPGWYSEKKVREKKAQRTEWHSSAPPPFSDAAGAGAGAESLQAMWDRCVGDNCYF